MSRWKGTTILQLVDTPEWEKADTNTVRTVEAPTTGTARESQIQGYGFQNLFVSLPLFLVFWGNSHLGRSPQTLAIVVTMRESHIPGYKPISDSIGGGS